MTALPITPTGPSAGAAAFSVGPMGALVSATALPAGMTEPFVEPADAAVALTGRSLGLTARSIASTALPVETTAMDVISMRKHVEMADIDI